MAALCQNANPYGPLGHGNSLGHGRVEGGDARPDLPRTARVPVNEPPRLGGVINTGQRTAVVGAFKLAGYDRPLFTAPVTSEDERAFLLRRQALDALCDVRTLEQVLQQILGRKVFVVEEDGRWGEPVPFA